ncbi:hypothetical protein IB633_03665 [Francisella philomiragia]|uniref:Uncharacterized protein n=1 Tax=Francisella philomiragia subsp. philomiragia (strain ATCC 25017 / CCUG 19701 / FSC 153 / O\|nr:hypothetical protein [Francisella philomiragia]AJI47618.1 putative membrane protein [Francisella philomiragia]AJI48451.1 putative membrane protein [Francisella philomiragia]MBK2020486.1 hypothetical protein [Francisella philomiragia]MBK2030186.1 hypothetical protein [Francisella philomiragia]MBK2263183.1 hypothetical protein [Francisella philomiragia]
MILVYILFILYFVPVILAMTGLEVGIAKIFFKDKTERKVGRSFPLTLYIFGAIAFWVTASFLLFFQKGLISYFNLGDHQFIFNAYILSGVLCYAGYLSLNSENYDKENPTIYSRTAMFVYLLVSSIIILSVFIFFGLSLIGFASSAQRAADILDILIYLCVIIFVIVYGWYLINRFCARYFSMAKILKVNMIVFIIYFIATPAYLYGTKFYTEYKQRYTTYEVFVETVRLGGKVFSIKVSGNYLESRYIQAFCKDNICDNQGDFSIELPVESVNQNLEYKYSYIGIDNLSLDNREKNKKVIHDLSEFILSIKNHNYDYRWEKDKNRIYCIDQQEHTRCLFTQYIKTVKNCDLRIVSAIDIKDSNLLKIEDIYSFEYIFSQLQLIKNKILDNKEL